LQVKSFSIENRNKQLIGKNRGCVNLYSPLRARLA
jgi:hypothetical protein